MIHNKARFFILSTQRSGSTMLAGYLSSHPDIYMARELFKGSDIGYNTDQDRFNLCNLSIDRYLDNFYSKKQDSYQGCGFKLMYDQIPDEKMIDFFINEKIKCIYLERKNILKTCISRLIARKNNIYHSDKKVSLNPVNINVPDALNELGKIEGVIHDSRQIADKLDTINCYYEDLVNNTEQNLKSIINFIGVNWYKGLTCTICKINSNDLKLVVKNYEELCDALRNTNYSKYLTT